MGLFNSGSSPGEPFQAVQVFVALRGAAKMADECGSIVSLIPPKTMIATADAQRRLGGALVAYCDRHSLSSERVPEMDNAQWQEFLDRRYPGQQWSRWFGKTPNAMYSVVVVYP